MELVEAIASMSGSSLGYLSESANSAGACLAGSLPHRQEAGVSTGQSGQNTSEILAAEHRVLMLMGHDPALDISQGSAVETLAKNNEFIISVNSFDNEFNQQYADLVLPLATFLETSGTFVNVDGLWQSFKGCVRPAAESRQGWKILAALAKTLLPADDYHYTDTIAIRNELKESCRELELNNFVGQSSGRKLPARPINLQKVSETALYAVDELVRHADVLQATINMSTVSRLKVNRAQAEKLGLNGVEQVQVTQDEGTAVLSVEIDEDIPAGCAWIPGGIKSVQNLSVLFGSVDVEKVS